MSRLIKDLEDGDDEGWYGEFYDVEIYQPDEDEWESYADQCDRRSQADGYAQHIADTENAKARIVIVREIRQPIAGAVFKPSSETSRNERKVNGAR